MLTKDISPPVAPRVQRLADPAAIDSIDAEWNELDAAISPRTPFSTPLWNRLWWRHLGAHGWLVHDEFCLHVVRDGDDRLVGVAPLILTHRPGGGLLRIRELQFFGADANLTELRGLICRDEDRDRVLPALLAALARTGIDWHWLRLGRIKKDSPAVSELLDKGALAWVGEVSDFVLDLPASWAAFRAALPRNIRESLRKCYNSLERQGYSCDLRIIQSPTETPAALDRFFALHAARAGAPFAVKHRDLFADPAARQFLIEYANQMALTGQLHLFELHVAGEIRASRIGFQFGDELYLYYSGYDPAWARFSIMTTALAEIIQWAIEHQFRIVNLSTGSDVSKTRWRPREVRYGEAVQFGAPSTAKPAYHAFEAARRLSRRTSLVGQLRRLSRRRR